jgi:hypothetical protein
MPVVGPLDGFNTDNRPGILTVSGSGGIVDSGFARDIDPPSS